MMQTLVIQIFQRQKLLKYLEQSNPSATEDQRIEHINSDRLLNKS